MTPIFCLQPSPLCIIPAQNRLPSCTGNLVLYRKESNGRLIQDFFDPWEGVHSNEHTQTQQSSVETEDPGANLDLLLTFDIPPCLVLQPTHGVLKIKFKNKTSSLGLDSLDTLRVVKSSKFHKAICSKIVCKRSDCQTFLPGHLAIQKAKVVVQCAWAQPIWYPSFEEGVHGLNLASATNSRRRRPLRPLALAIRGEKDSRA